MNPTKEQEQWLWVLPISPIRTKCWKDNDGNIVVEWDSVLLVYPELTPEPCSMVGNL